MANLRRLLAFVAIVISVSALLAALFGDGMMRLFVGVFTLGQGSGTTPYPLGAGVFVVYVCALALGLAGQRWPAAAGTAMLPLGAIAYVYGGPVAKAFGIAIGIIGVALLATGLGGNGTARSPESSAKH